MHSRGIRHLLTPIGVSPYRPLYAAFCRSIDHRGARQRTVRQARTSTAFRRHYARIAVQPTQDDVADDIASLGLGEGPSSSSGVVLRPYQEQAIDACLTALDEGVNRMGVSLPTGSGKTTIFMSLIPRIVEKEGKRKKTLILVNAVELATQAEAAGRRLLGEDWSIEMEQGKNQATGLADVTIATFQTLLREHRFEKFNPSSYGLVIVDEAHHSAARSYLRILQHFNQDVQLPSAVEPMSDYAHGRRVPIIGFTATFKRDDQLALSAAYEKIVFHRETRTMLSEGWLCPAKATSVHADLDLSNVATSSTGDFKTAELSSKMDKPEINQLLIKTYRHLAAARRSTLIFCVDLAHVEGVVSTFRNAGIDARSVSSMSKPGYRRETLAAFMKGEFPVLVNCEVLTEGTDIPVIDCVILARPTKSQNLLLQMVGRGLRLSPETGKTDCHIIDISDNLSRGLTVSPTLLGLTQDALEGTLRERERAETQGSDNASAAPLGAGRESATYKVRIIDEQDPFNLEGKEAKFLAIAQMSYYAWIACGGQRYVLSLFRSSYIKIEPSEEADQGAYAITYTTKPPSFWAGGGSKYKLTKPVAYADSLERAFAAGDAFVEGNFGRERSKMFERNAPWRSRLASKAQLNMLYKLKGVDAPGDASDQKDVSIMGRKVPISKITAGMIDSYMTATNRGAFTKKKTVMQKEESREARRLAKEEKKNRGNLPLPEEI